MTDQEKDHAVALSMGIVSENQHGILYQTKDGLSHNCPPFGKCLNAIRDAENVLTNQFNTVDEAYWRYLQHVKPHPIYATASQRREAYLRTLNLLKE